MSCDVGNPAFFEEDRLRAETARYREMVERMVVDVRNIVEFLEDLEASDNPATDARNPQAAGFYMGLYSLRDALREARALLSGERQEVKG